MKGAASPSLYQLALTAFKITILLLCLPVALTSHASSGPTESAKNNSTSGKNMDAQKFRRTYLTLTGHAVDLLAREGKFPSKLEKRLGGKLIFAQTDISEKLLQIKREFSCKIDPETNRGLGGPEERITAADGHEEAERKKSKFGSGLLKELLSQEVIAPAAGAETDLIHLRYWRVPPSFFENGAWHFGGDNIGDWVAGDAPFEDGKRNVRQREIQIPIGAVDMSRYVTRADFQRLRAALFEIDEPEDSVGAEDALFRFLEDTTRGGMPAGFLKAEFRSACGGASDMIIRAPSLQVRVLLIENVANEPIVLNNFYVRRLNAAEIAGGVRTSAENARCLAQKKPESVPVFKARVLKAGETLVVPVELLLSYRFEGRSREYEAEKHNRYTEKQQAKALTSLTGNNVLQTIVLMAEEGPPAEEPGDPAGQEETAAQEEGSEHEEPSTTDTRKTLRLASISKDAFVAAIKRPAPVVDSKAEFVFGPNLAIDAINVNGARVAIEKFDPRFVVLFSGYASGSCPFVYSLGNRGEWLKEGTIIKHFGAKSRENVNEIPLKRFTRTVKISEEEREISYLDHVYLRVVMESGQTLLVDAASEDLAKTDGRYLVLKRGQSVTVSFDVPGNGVQQVYLGARGYYMPESPNDL